MAKITRLQQLEALKREINHRDENGRLRPATIDNLLTLRNLTKLGPASMARALGVPVRFVSAWYAQHYGPPFDKMELILELVDSEIIYEKHKNNA